MYELYPDFKDVKHRKIKIFIKYDLKSDYLQFTPLHRILFKEGKFP